MVATSLSQFASLSDAITKIGSNTTTLTVDTSTTVNLTAALSVPANINLSFSAGSVITVNSIASPTVAPTVGTPVQTAGTVDVGAHLYAYSWVTSGGETPIGPSTSFTVATAASSLVISGIPTLPTGVASWSLYRTTAGGTLWWRVTSGQTGTTYTDTMPDSTLITQTVPIIYNTSAPLTIYGPINAPTRQIFSAFQGMVQFDSQYIEQVYPEWWGAGTGSNTVGSGIDSTSAINAAIASIPSGGTIPVRFVGHSYRITSPIQVVNGHGYNNRHNVILRGQNQVRRSNDSTTGTVLYWDGNTTDPMINLHSRNCLIEGFIFVAGNTRSVNACIDMTATANDAQNGVITGNHFRSLYFAGEFGTILYGVLTGEGNIANNEHHLIQSCTFSFINGTNAVGFYINNGTGQSKFIEFEDCAFTSCTQGFACGLASATFLRCNFGACGLIAYFGGSYDPVTFIGCDSEDCHQGVWFGTSTPLILIGCRFATNQVTANPTASQAFITGAGDLLLSGTNFDVGTTNFYIALADGGVITALNSMFAQWPCIMTTVTNTVYNSATNYNYTQVLSNCKTASGTPTINPGTYFYGNNANYAQFELASKLRLGAAGGNATNNNSTYGYADIKYDPTTKVIQYSENGASYRTPVSVAAWPPSSASWTFGASGSGTLPNGDYGYAMSLVNYLGQETNIQLIALDVQPPYVGSLNSVSLTSVSLGPIGTISRKIYRYIPNSTAPALIATINDNTTTTFSDTGLALGAAATGTDAGAGFLTTGFSSQRTQPTFISSANLAVEPIQYMTISANATNYKVPLYSMGASINSPGSAWSVHTTAYSLVATDDKINVNAASQTMTLPNANAVPVGKVYTVKNTGLGTNTTVASAGGTIDGATTYTGLSSAYASAQFFSDGTNWFIT